MGGQTAFGYEQPDGTVKYAVTFSAIGIDECLQFIVKRASRYDAELTETATSLEDYFIEQRFEEEDTSWRILYRLDGTTLCRSWGLKGDLVFFPPN